MTEQSIEPDEVNTGMMVIVGAFIAVVFVLVVVLIQAWFYNLREDVAARRTLPATDPQTALGRALLEQEEQLNSYRWINRQAKIRAVPIEQAMKLVTAELASNHK
jgi:hypothetical protein